MLSLGPIAFLSPWFLVGLAALPIIYWIIRAIPPAPQRIFFPAAWLTRDLESENTSPQSTPWWLLLLRLLMAALIILAVAHPVANPQGTSNGTGPVRLLIDNGWAAAADWNARQDYAVARLESLARQDRSVILRPTAAPMGGKPERDANPVSPAQAIEQVQAMTPQPWAPDYAALAESVAQNSAEKSIFLSSGLDHGDGEELLDRLNALGEVELIEMANAGLRQVAIANVKIGGEGADVLLIRPTAQPALQVEVQVTDVNGKVLAQSQVQFAAEAFRQNAKLVIPPLLRGRVAQVRLLGARHAGTVYLLDARAQRPLVGIVEDDGGQLAQPLQSAQFYLARALRPYATIERTDIAKLMKSAATTVFLADRGRLPQQEETDVLNWIAQGGTLVRFAGPRLEADSESNQDPLLSQPLRRGVRSVGGALSWSNAQPLAAFESEGPLAGLTPSPEIQVERQVLAQTGSTVQAQVWSRLADGTPLVTARNHGRGVIIFVHTTADNNWSNLVVTGTFVEMLQRFIQLGAQSGIANAQSTEELRLDRMLNGYGQLIATPQAMPPVRANALLRSSANPKTPAGIYAGAQSALAHNLANAIGPFTPRTRLTLLRDVDGAPVPTIVDGAGETDWRPYLLAVLALLALADIFICLILRGLIQLPGPRRATVALAIFCFAPLLIDAANAESNVSELAADVRLACVRTGNAQIDAACLTGLSGLSRHLRLRTSVWAGEPETVTLDMTNLGLFPMLYWPIVPGGPQPDASAITRLNAYMQAGGLILFDLGVTQSSERSSFLPDEDIEQQLRDIVGRLDIPALAQLDEEHVLTHSFYILKRFPGRRPDAPVWIEAGGAEIGAPVSPVVIGSGDWMRAWNKAQTKLPGYAAGDARQQEMAMRFGINVVMYALTGTYKADQVHLPALLDRVGKDR